MIRDNALTYANVESPLTARELSSQLLNSLIVAFLLTIISYQATSLFLDLIFGLKPHHKTTLSTLHIYLLHLESAPLALLSSLTRYSPLTHIRHRTPRPHGPIARTPGRISASTTLRLLFALFLAPIINVLTVLIALEHETTISFDGAGFGGVGIGIRDNLETVKLRPFVDSCGEAVVKTGRMERSVVRFSVCKYDAGEEDVPLNGNGVGATVFEGRSVSVVGRGGEIGGAFVILGEFVGACEREGWCEGKSGLLLRPSGDMKELVEWGVRELGCDVNGLREWEGGWWGDCEGKGWDETVQVMDKMTERVSLIETEKMEVALLTREKLDWQDIGESEFLVRKRRWVSLAWLGIIAGIVLIGRLIVKGVTRNDIGEGVGAILKERVGRDWWESLIREGGTIGYGYGHENSSNDSLNEEEALDAKWGRHWGVQ